MNEGVRNLIVGSLVLVLASMYGGDMLGSWFVMKVDVEDDDQNASLTGTDKYYLTETKGEIEYQGSDMPDDEDYDVEYEDDECSLDEDDWEFEECKELSGLMVDKIQNLLYVVVLAGFAALFFLSQGDDEKGAMACLVMGGAGLLAVGMFALSFPEALEDDSGIFETIEETFGLDADPSLAGSDRTTEDGVEISVSWRPDIASVLVLLSGILGIAAYSSPEILNSGTSNTSSYQNEYQYGQKSTSMPSIPSLSGPGVSFDNNNVMFKPQNEMASIQCPECGSQMQVPKLGSLQTVTCKSCGLSGEIKI